MHQRPVLYNTLLLHFRTGLEPCAGIWAALPLGDTVDTLGLCFLTPMSSPTGGALVPGLSLCQHWPFVETLVPAWQAGYPDCTKWFLVFQLLAWLMGGEAGRRGVRRERSGYPSISLLLPSTHCKQSPPSPYLGVPPCLSSGNCSLPHPAGSQSQLLHYPLHPAHTFDVVPCGTVLNWFHFFLAGVLLDMSIIPCLLIGSDSLLGKLLYRRPHSLEVHALHCGSLCPASPAAWTRPGRLTSPIAGLFPQVSSANQVVPKELRTKRQRPMGILRLKWENIEGHVQIT